MDKSIVLAEWQRGEGNLRTSDLSLREALYAPAISNAYYAILHAARAALHVHNVVATTHSGTSKMFSKHLVLTKEIEIEWGAYLVTHADSRRGADYDVKRHFTIEEAQHENTQAHAFTTRIRQYLLTKGMTEQELNPE